MCVPKTAASSSCKPHMVRLLYTPLCHSLYAPHPPTPARFVQPPPPPPPGTTVPLHPGGHRRRFLPQGVTVPPPRGMDTTPNQPLSSAYYVEFMAGQLLAVGRSRIRN